MRNQNLPSERTGSDTRSVEHARRVCQSEDGGDTCAHIGGSGGAPATPAASPSTTAGISHDIRRRCTRSTALTPAPYVGNHSPETVISKTMSNLIQNVVTSCAMCVAKRPSRVQRCACTGARTPRARGRACSAAPASSAAGSCARTCPCTRASARMRATAGGPSA